MFSPKSTVLGHVEKDGNFAPGPKPSKKQLNPPGKHNRPPSHTIIGIKDEMKKYPSVKESQAEHKSDHVKLLRDEEADALKKTRQQFEALTANMGFYMEEDAVVMEEKQPITTMELTKKE